VSLSIICAKCDRKLRVPETAQGRAVKCPGCGKVNRVPAADDVDDADDADDDVKVAARADDEDGPRRSIKKSRADSDDEPPRRARRRRDDEDSDLDDDADDEDEDYEEVRGKRRRTRVRPASLALRIVAISLAVLAGLLSATRGVIGALDRTKSIETYRKNPDAYVTYNDQLMGAGEAEDVAQNERIAFMLMVANLALACVAAVTASKSRGLLGGVVMLLAPVLPGIILPFTLFFTGLFVPAAIPFFFIWPRKA
jgi:hypothetical protein